MGSRNDFIFLKQYASQFLELSEYHSEYYTGTLRTSNFVHDTFSEIFLMNARGNFYFYKLRLVLKNLHFSVSNVYLSLSILYFILSLLLLWQCRIHRYADITTFSGAVYTL